MCYFNSQETLLPSNIRIIHSIRISHRIIKWIFKILKTSLWWETNNFYTCGYNKYIVKTQNSNAFGVELFDTRMQKFDLDMTWYSNVSTHGYKQRLLASPSPATASCPAMAVRTTFSCILSVIFHLETYNGTKEAYQWWKLRIESASVLVSHSHTCGFTGLTPGDKLPDIFMDGDWSSNK